MENRYGHDHQNSINKLKDLVIDELSIGIESVPKGNHWGYYPAHRCGEIGGSMVKKMIQEYENKLAK